MYRKMIPSMWTYLVCDNWFSLWGGFVGSHIHSQDSGAQQIFDQAWEFVKNTCLEFVFTYELATQVINLTYKIQNSVFTHIYILNYMLFWVFIWQIMIK